MWKLCHRALTVAEADVVARCIQAHACPPWACDGREKCMAKLRHIPCPRAHKKWETEDVIRLQTPGRPGTRRRT